MAPISPSQEPETSVWLVEDKRILRSSLATLIGEQPDMCCPVAVATCEEMLAALDEGLVPDIVLMDIGLPGMSGIEGVRRLRSLTPSTRVIILTIHEEDEKVFDAVCAGASGYLLKPSSPEGIVDAIHQVERGAAPINAYIAQKMLAMFARLAPPRAADTDYHLTRREKEILQLLVDGLTMQQIAGRLYVSYHTVDNHIRNIYEKLHVHSRSGVVAKALKERLL
jgi:DNA-binding NarL/FixJ family response regulator